MLLKRLHNMLCSITCNFHFWKEAAGYLNDDCLYFT